ncbi:jg9181, partial [Pararge aegeria aegeria]
MGRVTEVHPGHDGLIRVVTLKTKNGLMKRPVAKLSILPLQPQKEGSVYQQEKERKEDKYQSNKKYRSSSKVSNFISMAISFILFITFISPTNASYNITHFKNNQSVYLDYISDLQIIRDEWTMIVYYNMSPYWEGMITVKKFNSYLEKTCETFQEQTQCHMILQQLQYDYNELQYYSELLLNQEFNAHARQRRGLINGIGYVANTLFGVLDERFAENYKKDIQQVRTNQNHLAALWRNQTSVVEAEYNLLKRTADLISKQHKIINKHLNILDQSTIYMKEQIQKLSSVEDFTLSAITATNIVNNLKRSQDTLLDTLTDIYHGKLNIHLITPEQLRLELQIISSHLSKDLTIPIENIYDETSINNSLNKIKEQIQVMKKNAELAELDLSGHDIHQYILSYGLIAAAAALGGLILWRRCRHVRVVPPSPAPAPEAKQSDFSE